MANLLIFKETNTDKRGLAELQMTLRGIQEEQLRQGEEVQRMASELRQPSRTESRQGGSQGNPARILGQSDATQRRQGNNLDCLLT